MVKLVANPLVLRAGLGFLALASLFVLAVWLVRSLRRNLVGQPNFDSSVKGNMEALPFHVYNTVIQQLKQQKHELQIQTQAEQRRARTTENFSQAVLSHLSSGVLVFGANGLVRQANPAAKKILGFTSPVGMSIENIFRNAHACAADGGAVPLVDVVTTVLRDDNKPRQLEADYTTPAGHILRIAVTVSPVSAVEGDLLGVACLISDRSEFERIRRQEEVQEEISSEMALELRTSLATISGYAQQLAKNRDPDLAPQLAADIAGEAARLDRRIGGFLAARRGGVASAVTGRG